MQEKRQSTRDCGLISVPVLECLLLSERAVCRLLLSGDRPAISRHCTIFQQHITQAKNSIYKLTVFWHLPAIFSRALLLQLPVLAAQSASRHRPRGHALHQPCCLSPYTHRRAIPRKLYPAQRMPSQSPSNHSHAEAEKRASMTQASMETLVYYCSSASILLADRIRGRLAYRRLAFWMHIRTHWQPQTAHAAASLRRRNQERPSLWLELHSPLVVAAPTAHRALAHCARVQARCKCLAPRWITP